MDIVLDYTNIKEHLTLEFIYPGKTAYNSKMCSYKLKQKPSILKKFLLGKKQIDGRSNVRLKYKAKEIYEIGTKTNLKLLICTCT